MSGARCPAPERLSTKRGKHPADSRQATVACSAAAPHTPTAVQGHLGAAAMSTIAPPAVRTVSTTRIAVASFIGTAIEFYDFYIYGTAAALVLGKLFFPTFSALAGTLAAFATFGVGFVA